jgi:hypothetical protein
VARRSSIVSPEQPPRGRVRQTPSVGGSVRSVVGILLAALLAGAAGCASQKGYLPPSDLTLPDASRLYETISRRCQGITSLEGSAHVRLIRSGKKARVEEVVAIRRPSSLRMETMDFWGHTVFLVILHNGKCLTYAPGERRYQVGEEALDELRNLIGFACEPDEMVRLLLGDPLYTETGPASEVAISSDEGYYRLDIGSGNGTGARYSLWVGQGDLPVRSLMVSPPRGGTWVRGFQVEYGRYTKTDGIDFPLSLVISDPSSGSRLEVEYASVSLNTIMGDDVFDMNVP